MNKYLIPLIVTTCVGIYYLCNIKKNNTTKTLEIKDTNKDKTNKDKTNKDKTNKDIIKLKTTVELKELDELNELKEIKELKEINEIKDKSKYQIVVYKKPEDWEIVD